MQAMSLRQCLFTIISCALASGYIDRQVQQAELREATQNRVAAYCHRLGRTVAEDRDGKFTCEDLAPSWAMRSHVMIAQRMREMR